MTSHLTPGLYGFIAAWLPGLPARVLDVGCGRGELTRRLRENGYEATGVDPDAPEGDGFERTRIEAYSAAQPFDAAVAIRSLHHVDDLQDAVASLASNLREGARLILFEFAIEAVDDAALRWLDAHGLRHPVEESDPEEVIPLEALAAAIASRFALLHREPAPYLAREAGRADLEQEELAGIVGGQLRPAGARLVYRRS